MAEVYPASLPDWRLGLDIVLGDGTVRNPNEVGPASVRRRSSAVPDRYEVPPKIYTAAQATTLRTFYKTTLKGGALTFTHEDLLDGTSVEFRFVGPPIFRLIKGSPVAANRLWQVVMTVEQMP